MLYLNEKDIVELGMNWNEVIDELESAVSCLGKNEFSQPLKPYLRFGNPKNRIIAMPAYVGGNIDMSGIKWIASFPENIERNIPRAHSVVILNDTKTGKPVSILNTALISIVRTASVSGLIIRHYMLARQLKSINLGIIGWGPIGRHHFKMCMDLYGDIINKVYIYDINTIDKDTLDACYARKVIAVDSWQSAYEDADVFITCTVSKAPYINTAPKEGSLQLNVSLRDYQPEILDYVKNAIIVDDWDEVCRENTDIENMHKQKGLKREDTQSIYDIVCKDAMNAYKSSDTVMFNPMGMAIFDITVGNYYMKKALELNVGVDLE